MGKENTWGDVSEGGGSGANFLKVEAGQSAVVHVLGGDKGPKVFHSVYFAAINRGAIVDPNANPLAGLEDGYETRKRYAFGVVDMADGQVKAFACGSQVANQIKGIYTEYGNLDEVDLKITRIGTGLKTKYQIIPVKKKFTEEMLEGVEIPDLDEVFAITADEAIEKMMRGEDPKGEDGEKAAPAPKAKKTTAALPAEEPAEAEQPAEDDAPPAAEDDAPPAVEEDETPKKAAPAPAAPKTDNSRAALLQAIKGNFSKLKRYANPKQQLVDIQHFGGKDKSALSQLDTAILLKMLNFQKTAK